MFYSWVYLFQKKFSDLFEAFNPEFKMIRHNFRLPLSRNFSSALSLYRQPDRYFQTHSTTLSCHEILSIRTIFPFAVALPSFFKQRLILRGEPRPERHERKGDKICKMRNLAKDSQRERRADKRRNRIIGARSCRTKLSLRIDIEKYTQPIRDKPHAQNRKNTPYYSDALSYAQPD